MSYRFFLSYARDDDFDGRISKLFADLSMEIRGLIGATSSQPVGFQDKSTIITGAQWSAEIIQALQTSKVFVCVLTQTYLNRDFCGREFQAFYERLELFMKNNPGPQPEVILPVLYIPISVPLPLPLGKFHHHPLPSAYATQGLHHMIRLSRRALYYSFLRSFAERITISAKTWTLPPHPSLKGIRSVRNAFSIPGSNASPKTGLGGPNQVNFVFVAAKSREMRRHRSNLAPYGNKGASWKPYLIDNIGAMAQEIALSERFAYTEMDFTSQLLKKIHEAEKRNEIVVIVLDVWTVKLPRYEKTMRRYDLSGIKNCAVLIPWNDEDSETRESRASLNEQLLQIFKSKPEERSAYFQNYISSAKALKDGIRNALVELKLKIIEHGQAEKRIGGKQIPKPTIPVPSGDA